MCNKKQITRDRTMQYKDIHTIRLEIVSLQCSLYKRIAVCEIPRSTTLATLSGS